MPPDDTDPSADPSDPRSAYHANISDRELGISVGARDDIVDSSMALNGPISLPLGPVCQSEGNAAALVLSLLSPPCM